MKGTKRFLFACLVAGINYLQVSAQHEEFTGSIVLGPPDSFAGDILTVIDDKWNDPLWATIDTHLAVKNLIIFEMNPSLPRPLPFPFRARLEVTVKTFGAIGDSSSFTADFEINYDTTDINSFKQREIVQFSNAHKVVITIGQLCFLALGSGSSCSSSNHQTICDSICNNDPYTLSPYVIDSLYDIFRLRAIVQIDRDYLFDCDSTVDITHFSFDTLARKYLFRWGDYDGAEEYDMEWTFYDSLSYEAANNLLGTSNATTFQTFFQNNSTRITITEHQYDFPAVYPKGVLIWRVRAVHYNAAGDRLTSKWSTELASMRMGINSSKAQEPNLNWQFQSVFAEGGKNSPSLNYFDGSLRQRQSVSLSNSISSTIVGETIYDHQGRPAIKVLPSPTDHEQMKYYKKFNLDIYNNRYSRMDFDTGGCAAYPLAMKADSGSSRYYSTNNTDSAGFPDRFIPDAEGYPFTVTEWTPDLTGRIRRQSQAGEPFRFGYNRETRNLYGKPTQAEMDRLFGNEVGNFTHYQKNLVLDPNRQVSVTYLDMHGRTIATALAGDTPGGMDTLASNLGPVTLYDNILNNPQTTSNGCLISTYQLTVSKESYHQFFYIAQPNSYQPPCLDSICYDCLYDLTVRISDDCGNNFDTITTGQPFVFTKRNFTIPNPDTLNFDTLCSTPGAGIIDTLLLYLPVGSYNITKSLCVSSAALDFYTEHYLRQEGCVEPFSTFYDTLIAQLDLTSCFVSCDSCRSSLGTEADFIMRFCQQIQNANGTPAATDTAEAQQLYAHLLAECNVLCLQMNECNILYQQMLIDVSPGGQYMQYVTSIDANNEIVISPSNAADPYPPSQSSDTAGYFNLLNESSIHYHMNYMYPLSPYLNENGQPDLVINNAGDTASPQNLSVSEFINNFNPSWAYSLVQYHPEYRYYQFCSNDSMNGSNSFDSLMWATDTYDSAYARGLLNPLNQNVPYSSNNVDSFFYTGSFGYAYQQAMKDTLLSFGNDTGFSIWDLAYATVYCRDTTVTCTPDTLGTGCTQDNNSAWIAFRSFYMSAKSIFVDTVRENYVTQFNARNYPIGRSSLGSIPNPHHMVYLTTGSDGNSTSQITVNYYRYNTKRVIHNNEIIQQIGVPVNASAAANTNWVNNQINNNYEDLCETFSYNWIQQLMDCPNMQYLVDSNMTDTINNIRLALRAVCECDTNHTMQQYPLGVRDCPQGVAYTDSDGTYTFHNFHEVLDHYLWNIDPPNPDTIQFNHPLCNEHLLFPPYESGNQPLMANPVLIGRPDSCVCTTIASLETDYQNDTVGTYNDFADYLAQHYQSTMTQSEVDEIMDMCDSILTCSYMTHPIQMPTVLACRSCVHCDTVAAAVVTFYAEYPNAQAFSNYTTLFTSYLNNVFGLSLSFNDYIDFLYQCASDSADTAEVMTVLPNPTIANTPIITMGHGPHAIPPGTGVPSDTATVPVHLHPVPIDTLTTIIGVFNDPGLGHIVSSPYYIPDLLDTIYEITGWKIPFSDVYDILYVLDGAIPDSLGWDSLPYPTTDPFVDCSQLVNHVSLFNLCHYPAPNFIDYPCLLTDYLAIFYGPAHTFIEYYDTLLTCYDTADVVDLMGPRINCPSTLDAMTVINAVTEFLENNPGVWEDADYLEQLVQHLNQNFSAQHTIAGYTLIMSHLLTDPQIYTLLHGFVPQYTDTFDCAVLDSATIAFNVAYGGNYEEGGDPAYFVEYTYWMNNVFDLEDSIYVFCDFYRMLRNCFDSAYVDSLIGAPIYCDSSLSCALLQQAIIDFNENNEGAPYIENYDSLLTASLQAVFGSQYYFCDYYNRYTECYGLTATRDRMSESPYCEDTVSFTSLDYYVSQVERELWGSSPPGDDIIVTQAFRDAMADTLNVIFQKPLTFCEYYDMYAYYFGPGDAATYLGPASACAYDPCPDYDTIYVMTLAFNDSILTAYNDTVSGDTLTSALDVPGYMVHITSMLNNWFDYNFAYYQYNAIITYLHGNYVAHSVIGWIYSTSTTGTVLNVFVQGIPYINLNNIPFYAAIANGDAVLCPDAVFPPIVVDTTDDCLDMLLHAALSNARALYDDYLDTAANNFQAAYIAHCLSISDTFLMKHNLNEYHFTLYYYDQAGNLVKTVPPKGVMMLDSADVVDVQAYRNTGSGSPVFPAHTLETNYRYNTLEKPIEQHTPDGDTVKFWYDRLGRLRFSQNEKQAILTCSPCPAYYKGKYSYTKYDFLGRIIETGEADQMFTDTSVSDTVFWAGVDALSFPDTLMTEVVQTHYDTVFMQSMQPVFAGGQNNLRSRVVAITYEDNYDEVDSTYNSATHYTYDVAGNVKELVQENRALSVYGKQFKRIEYEYDLVSGKVNRVNYQPDSLDKFIHRYVYDKDNRLTEVYTSLDGLLWEQDARYEYYKHGPLARTELGDLQVQGMDFAYTINGWIKGMNSSVIDSTRDMGLDGLQSNWHAVFPADVQGYTLGYFSDDYKAVGRNASGFKNYEMAYAGSGYNSDAASLYNGNIRSMMVHLSRFDTIGYAYRYDQLNRITRMNVWDNINMTTYAWNNGGSALNDYKEKVTYDANGNILSYIRNAISQGGNPVYMDSLTYNYYGNSNKLKYVDDPITAARFSVDIDDQADSNYVYDKIGNLIVDSSEGLTITWSVNGKVKQIVNSNTDTTVTFAYDPAGNRISKKVETNTDTITTYYVRDAQGNILADYSLRKDTIHWSEMAMYGSSRLGLHKPDTIVYPSTWTDTGRIQYPNYIGRKNYELTNHLGNVLSTINDWKIGADNDTDQVVDYWQAVLMSQQDYYPFGMIQLNRNWTGINYRFGFNTQEKLDEVSGIGNHNSALYWEYDTRLNRRWNIDPVIKAHESGYAAFSNNPIWFIDPLGNDTTIVDKKTGEITSYLDEVTITAPKPEWMNDLEDSKNPESPNYILSDPGVTIKSTGNITDTRHDCSKDGCTPEQHENTEKTLEALNLGVSLLTPDPTSKIKFFKGLGRVGRIFMSKAEKAVEAIPESKLLNHVMVDKHKWGKVVLNSANSDQVKAIMIKVLEEGKQIPFGKDFAKVLNVNGELVRVTFAVVKGNIKVGTAYVIDASTNKGVVEAFEALKYLSK